MERGLGEVVEGSYDQKTLCTCVSVVMKPIIVYNLYML